VASVAAQAPTAATAESGRTRVALLLAAAAILTAGLATWAEVLSSSASDAWQSSGRVEIKRSAAMLVDVSQVYVTELPRALAVLEDGALAQALQQTADAAGGSVGAELRNQALVDAALVQAATPSQPLVADDRYRRGAGFDLALRLRDVRAENPGLVALDPRERLVAGDDDSAKSDRVLAATLPAALAFLAGALAQGFPRRRRVLLATGVVALAAAVVFAAIAGATG
jgi:hypothetical protein